MNCQTLDFCLSVFCIVKLWTREVSVNHATISILNLRLLRLSLLKGAVPTVLSSLSAPSLLSYVPRSLNPHLCFSASSHLICFPAPAVLSLACPCSLLLTCSCESSWNKVQPLTPPAVSCFLGTACLFSSWPHLPVDQVCLSVFFSFRIIITNSSEKNRKQWKSGDHTLHRSTSRTHETPRFILICPLAVRVRQLARLQNHLTRNECRLYTFKYKTRARCYCVFVGILYRVNGVIEVITGQL